VIIMGKLALAAVLAWPLVAQADPKPTPHELQQAGELVKKAIAKSQAGDHELAIELYKQAYELVPQPILLSNIGSEYDQAKKPVLALKFFCKYLDADPTGSNASYATAKAKAIQIDLGNPPADDASVCKPPKPAESTPTPPAATPVASGTTTGTPLPAAPPPESSDDHPGRTFEYAGGVAAAVGVAGLVAGSVFALKAKSLSDAINAHNIHDPWPDTLDGVPIKEWDAQGAAWNRDTYIFMIGGAVALGAGIGLFVYGYGQSPTKTETSVSIVPTPGGLAAFGRF
jgi:tetratricopeptide (TPR) repeat protein